MGKQYKQLKYSFLYFFKQALNVTGNPGRKGWVETGSRNMHNHQGHEGSHKGIKQAIST